MAGLTIAVPDVDVDVVNAAEQLVAFVDDQVRVEFWPLTIEVGFAERLTEILLFPPPPPVLTVTVAVAVLVAVPFPQSIL